MDRQVKAYRIADITVCHMRRYRDPEEVKRLNADVVDKGQLVAAILALIDGKLVLADGHCRFEALQAAGRTEILAWVDPRLDSYEKLLAFLFDTETRSNRNPVDLGLYLRAYQEQHKIETQRELSLRLKLSESAVSRCLAVFEYPDDIVDFVGKGKLTVAHTMAVKSVPEKAVELLRKAASEGLNATQLKALLRPKRNSKVMKLKAGGLTALVPSAMSVEAFDEAIAQVRNQVAAAEKAASKKHLTVSQVLGAS